MYQDHLEKLSRTRLDDILIDEGVLARDSIEDAQAEHEMTGQSLSSILLDRDALDEWELAKVVSTHYSLPFIDITDLSLSPDVMDLLPLEFCVKHAVLPLDHFGAVFTLAVSEMPPAALLEQIIEQAGKMPFLYVAVRRQVRDMLEQFAQRQEKSGRRPPPKPRPKPSRAMPEPDITQVPAEEPVPAAGLTNALGLLSADDFGGTVPTEGLKPVSMDLSASVPLRSRRPDTRPIPAHPATAPRTPEPVTGPPALGMVTSTETPALGDSASRNAWESIFDLGEDAVHSE